MLLANATNCANQSSHERLLNYSHNQCELPYLRSTTERVRISKLNGIHLCWNLNCKRRYCTWSWHLGKKKKCSFICSQIYTDKKGKKNKTLRMLKKKCFWNANIGRRFSSTSGSHRHNTTAIGAGINVKYLTADDSPSTPSNPESWADQLLTDFTEICGSGCCPTL